MRPTIRGRETPALTQHSPAPLERVATFRQTLDARICRNDRRDLGADLSRGAETEGRGALGTGTPPDLREDRPLGPCFARTRTGDLGAEHHASFGGRFGAAARL